MELQTTLVENLQNAGENVGTVIHLPSPALGFAQFSSKSCSSLAKGNLAFCLGSNFSLVCYGEEIGGLKDWGLELG